MKTFAKGTLFYLAMAVVGVVGQSCFDRNPKPNGLPKQPRSSRNGKKRNINQQPQAKEAGIGKEQTSMPATIPTLETTSSNVIESSTDASQPSTPPQVYDTNGDDLESNGEDLPPKGPNINQQPQANETSIGKEQTSMPATILSTVQKTSSNISQPSTSPQVYATNGNHLESNGGNLSPKSPNIKQQTQANGTGIGKEQNLKPNKEDVENESHKNENYYKNIVNTLISFFSIFEKLDKIKDILDSNPTFEKHTELKDFHDVYNQASPVYIKCRNYYEDLYNLKYKFENEDLIKQQLFILAQLDKCIDDANMKQCTKNLENALSNYYEVFSKCYKDVNDTLETFRETYNKLSEIIADNPIPQNETELGRILSAASPAYAAYEKSTHLDSTQNTPEDKYTNELSILAQLDKFIDDGNIKQLTQEMKKAIDKAP
ncbi:MULTISPECIES: hypothetical protein [Candidatus Cardinium]|uniref:hypothetical protein n=1 Tax=Candidatus Cardinium TaxID=273135 RepID=UPI001FAAEB40|nr:MULTISPECIES: hypothetical protein [Cardinium]